MLRASAICEAAGIPTSTLVCEGFLGQAATTSIGLGMPNLPVARVPGHVGVQGPEELRRNVLGVTAAQVVDGLTRQPAPAAAAEASPAARDIVFQGSLDQVNDHFIGQEWSDGLPFVPPTIERVERFLRFTDRAPEERIGTLLPDNRAATVRNVAVNGVMAGVPPGVHAAAAGARRGDGRSILWCRA